MKPELNNGHPPTIMENGDVVEEEENSYSESDDDDEHDEDEKYLALLQFQRICSRNQELQRLYAGDDSEEKKNMLWTAARSLGSALSIITPIAIISLIFRHDSFIFRIFNQCDRAIRSVFFPTPVKRDSILKWLQDTLPGDKRTKSLDSVWSDGSVLCELVESVVPGSCVGHIGEERIDLQHGQRLAEQYLGVAPIFSPDELSNTILSTYQECRLTHYLNSVREAIYRLSPPISRSGSPLLNFQAFTLDYVARGMGLVSAFKNMKSTFYLYPTAQQSLEPGDISVQIKGPGNCYGSILIPVIYGRAHIIRNMFFNMDKNNYPTIPMQPDYPTSNIARTSLKSKVRNDIEVNIVIKHDRVKVTYIPTIAGYHELSLISKGCHLMGSPFSVNVELAHAGRQNSSDCLEEDLLSEEQVKIERKIVFRIVDFVTEKMLLREDGTLEKISVTEAESILKSIESINGPIIEDYHESCVSSPDLIDQLEEERLKPTFGTMANRVVLMVRVCKRFARFNKYATNKVKDDINAYFITTPDVVNSTFNDTNIPKNTIDPQRISAQDMRSQFKNKSSSFNSIAERPSIEIIISSIDEDDNLKIEPYRSHTPIDCMIRPKTPVLQILEDEENESDEATRPNSPFIDFHIGAPVSPINIPRTAKCKLAAEIDSIILAPNLEEALNKFDQKIQNSDHFETEKSETSIFSTPLRNTAYEQMTDLEILQMYEGDPDTEVFQVQCEEDIHDFSVGKGEVNVVESRNGSMNTQYSFESGDSQRSSNHTTRNNSIDTWDSAYASIDDLNSSPDSHSSSSRSNYSLKSKLNPISESENELISPIPYEEEEYNHMGPAEKEIWSYMAKDEATKNNNIPKIYIENETKTDENQKLVKPVGNPIEKKVINISYKVSRKPLKIDDSASDLKADVIRSKKSIVKVDENVAFSKPETSYYNETPSPELIKDVEKSPKKPQLSKMVSEKKEYWDEKIKTNLKISDVETKPVKKKSNILRRNDSLSKKRGKLVTSSMTEKFKQTFESSSKNSNKQVKPQGSLVSKWKNYWDEKVEKSLSPEPESYISLIDEVVENEEKKQSNSFLGLSAETEELLEDFSVSTFSENAKNETTINRYQPKALNLGKLSERIDLYMKTVSPVQESERSEASTPDNFNLAIQKLKTDTKEKDILPLKSSKINTEKETFTSCIFHEVPVIPAKETPPMSNVKAKIQLIRSKSCVDGRELFSKVKSQINDCPETKNFHQLRKYFSVDVIHDSNTKKKNNFQTTLRNMNKDNTSSRSLGGTKVEKNPEDGSTESLVSISERKVRLENHLKEIQIRRQNVMNEYENRIKEKPQVIRTIQPIDRDPDGKQKVDARYEDLESFQRLANDLPTVKPIKLLVAAFENISSSKPEEKITRHEKVSKKVWSTPATIQEKKCVTDKKIDAEKGEDGAIVKLFDGVTNPACAQSTSDLTKDDEDLIKSENYKKHFRKTKQFFQTLGRLKNTSTETVKARPLNECESLLMEEDHKEAKQNKEEKPEKPVRQKKLRKIYVKANSAPTSDTECELRRITWHGGDRLIKISERFLVEDLFSDIAGESTRTSVGTFKGIPHKHAVLAAFKSMESISQPSSYEFCTTQMKDFAKKNGVVNSQTYHSEYPHLPTTDPSMYRPRYDAAASGLVMRRDLLRFRKARRNSAPDENTTFSSCMITNV